MGPVFTVAARQLSVPWLLSALFDNRYLMYTTEIRTIYL